MSEKAPFEVASAIASATAFEPVANLSISKTPTGPFHRIVLQPTLGLVLILGLGDKETEP